MVGVATLIHHILSCLDGRDMESLAGIGPTINGVMEAIASTFQTLVHARPEGWLVIFALILPFTCRAIIRLLAVQKRLAEERGLLARCWSTLTAVQSDGRIVERDEIDRCLQGAAADSLTAKAINAIWASRTLPNPDLEAIATMLAQGEAARLATPRNTPNALLLSGLLGTVLGLAGAVSTLGPQIHAAVQSADAMTLTSNLAATLQHMQNAFVCTVWGILAAVLVSKWTAVVASMQSDLLSAVQEFGLREFAPCVIPRGEAAQLEDLRKILTQSRRFMTQITGLMTEAAKKFDGVLNQAGNAMVESIAQLSSVASGVQSTLVQASGDVRRSAESLQVSAEDLGHRHTDLKEAYVSLSGLFDESKHYLEQQAREQLSKLGDMESAFSNSAQSILARIDEASSRLTDATGSFADASSNYKNYTSEVCTELQVGFGKMTGDIQQALDAHNRETSAVEAELRRISNDLAELACRLDPRLLPKDEWEAVRDALVACTQQLCRLDKTVDHDFGPEVSLRIDSVTPRSKARPEDVWAATHNAENMALARDPGNDEPTSTAYIPGTAKTEPAAVRVWDRLSDWLHRR